MGVIVRILGPVTVERSPEPAVPLSPKPGLILALLAAHRGQVVSTDRLCDALWGEDQPAAALATLQSHVSRLRRLIGPDGDVVALDCGYRLNLPSGGLDAEEFERLVRQGSEHREPAQAATIYRSALAWWRGRAFGDYADNEWLQGEAVRLEELRITMTEEWIECRLAAGGDATMMSDLESFTTLHPLRERFQRQRMIALYRDDRQAEALRRGNEFRRLLRDDIGLDPSASFETLERRIIDNDTSLSKVPAPARTPRSDAGPTDDQSRLVGRDTDLERIRKAIGASQLVTLVGPGGVGKTRLAKRIAATIDGFSEMSVVVELAAVSEADSVPDVVATALDVQSREQITLTEAIVASLADREQFVVFDNCEHILDVLVPCLDAVRRHCPSVHILATSREPLGLPGEVVIGIAPLTVAPADVEGVEEIAAAPAVQLLVDRASAAAPGFAVTSANATVLNDICRRLDGLPLALELVAARFRSLDAATILERLETPSSVLGASMRTADPRHRTLRDTVTWSFAHLSAPEQRLFARLAVFAGSFDLVAVEAICSRLDCQTDDECDVVEPIETLAALVDKSMVQRLDSNGTRYQLLETLREFARERLEEVEPIELVLEAHQRWFVELAEQAGRGLTGPDEAEWSRRIDCDFDNYRAAFGRAIRTNNTDAALRLVASLREFAFRRIRYELAAWADTALELPDAEQHAKYLVVMAIVSYSNFVRGELSASVDIGLRAFERQTADRDTSGLAERALGNAIGFLGRTEEALPWMDRIVASARQGSPARLAHALYMRSVSETSVGRSVRGGVLAGEALGVANITGSPTALAQANYALGLALEGSEPEESLRLLRESVRLAGTAGNRWIEAFAQTEVWWLEARGGDMRTALTGAGKVIDTWCRGGDWANLQLSLRRVFGLLVQCGDHHAAAVVQGAVNKSGVMAALPFEPHSAQDLAQAADQIRTTLGSEAFNLALEVGAGLPMAALVAFVQEHIASLVSGASETFSGTQPEVDPQDVAELPVVTAAMRAR